ncbi:hypothetical protein DH2020_024302 [Rehmannia glutinosa]|uniref:Uncharacterized protein n=1 Tax=Rehmannia glutinosa TaxID=99300 RepID=A0ABR0W3Q0_REHGL
MAEHGNFTSSMGEPKIDDRQPPNRLPQLPHLPPLHPHPRRRNMAEQPRQQHRLPEIPPVAPHNHRRLNNGRLPRRIRRLMLPKQLPHVPLPVGHVLHHRRPPRLRNLRVRRHRQGSGRPVMNRAYQDYSLRDYSGWLADRVDSEGYWSKISSCIRDSRVCRRLGRNVGGVPESAEMFYMRRLSSIQSGCCKPPTSCGFVYINETVWNPGGGLVGSDPDCVRWTNDQDQLCYGCDSCKAGISRFESMQDVQVRISQ